MESAPAVVLGAAGEAWPRPGCRCVACASRPAPTTPLAALRVGGLLIAADGTLSAPGTPPSRPAAGEHTTVDGVRVLALPGGPPRSRPAGPSPSAGPGASRPALVLGVGGYTLLWAAGTGPLAAESLEALTDAGLDGAALDVRAAGTAGPAAVAHEIARLRAVRALSPGCDVLAVGWTHDTARGEVRSRLAAWGARRPGDGDPWPRRVAPAPAPPRTLVLGPASSGKSAVAEDLLAAEPEVVYAATGPLPGAGDAGWARRVSAHRRRRPGWWTTEESGNLTSLLATPGPPLLVDALGTWLTAAMDRCGAWEEPGEVRDGTGAVGWRERLDAEVDALVHAWRQAARRVVAVGEEVGWGVVPATSAGSRFREALGELTRRLAAESERVLLVVAGTSLDLTARLERDLGV